MGDRKLSHSKIRSAGANKTQYFRANRLTAVWNDYKLTPEMVTLIRRMNFYDNQLILILRRMRTARLEIQRRNQLLMETLRNQEAAGNEGEGDGVAHE